MGLFKRICFLVYGLVGMYFFGVLALACCTATQPYISYALTSREMRISMVVAGCILAFGCFLMLVRALFVRNRKVVIIHKDKSSQVSVSRAAIASQAKHTIEEDGLFVVTNMLVKSGKYGHVRVSARVQPRVSCDLIQAAKQLHDALAQSLQAIVGEHVDGIKLEFSRAQAYNTADDMQDEYLDDTYDSEYDASFALDSAAVHTAEDCSDVQYEESKAASAMPHGGADTPDVPSQPKSVQETSEITVSMTHYDASPNVHSSKE